MASGVDFVQIYFKPEQLEQVYPFARYYYNPELTPFFENTVISEVVNNSGGSKIGVCSWALRDKLKFYIPPKRELTL